MNRKLVLTILPVLILACFAPVPVTEAVSTEPPQSVNTGILINISEPAAPLAEGCTFTAQTTTNLRECAGLGCAIIRGDEIEQGEFITAVCPTGGQWALIPSRGWFCIAALTGTGGCNE